MQPEAAVQFEDFYDRSYSRVVRAIGLVLGDRDLAREAVDEALARAWDGRRRGKEVDSLEAWVRVVALNYARSRFRRAALDRRVRHRVATRDTTVVPDEGIGVDVHRALAKLSHRQREVVVLHYFLDLPVAEISNELHVAPGTVKATLHQARRELATLLSEDADSGIGVFDGN